MMQSVEVSGVLTEAVDLLRIKDSIGNSHLL